MAEDSAELRAKEAASMGLFRGGLFGMVGMSLMAVLWVGGSQMGEGSMTVSDPKTSCTSRVTVSVVFSGYCCF